MIDNHYMRNVNGKEFKLSKRERQMLPLLDEGKGYKEIGEELGISWMTVRSLLHRLYEKSGVGGTNAKVKVLGLWKG